MSDTERTPGEEIGWWAGVLGASATSILFAWYMVKLGEKKEKEDKPVSTSNSKPLWPIGIGELTQIGDAVMPDRHGRPHKGRDLMAPAGTRVQSSVAGKVLRVVDGRLAEKDSPRWRAGLFVDVRGEDGHVYRYLHLGSSTVQAGTQVKAGQMLGTVADKGTPGVLNSPPHLHFEIRRSDWDRTRGDYGEPIEPLSVLPRRFDRTKRA